MDDPLIPIGLGDDFGRGLTRLTDSGLSITEWRPLTGALPPMNEQRGWLNLKNTNKFPNTNCRTWACPCLNLNSFTGGNGAIVNWAASLDWSGRLDLRSSS